MSNSSQSAGEGRVKFGRGAQNSEDVGRPTTDPRILDVERPSGMTTSTLGSSGDGTPRNLFGNSENHRGRQGLGQSSSKNWTKGEDLRSFGGISDQGRLHEHNQRANEFSPHNEAQRGGGRMDDRHNSSGHSGAGARPCYMDGNRDEPNHRNHLDNRGSGSDHYRVPPVAPPVDQHQKQSEEARKACQENAMNLTKVLFHSREMTDVVIVAADGVEVKAHKVVLAVRSPVFKALFSNEDIPEEEKKRVLVAGDFSGELLEAFVELLYTGQAGKFEDRISCNGECQHLVFLLACRYQVEDLMTLAALKLTQDVGSENFVKLLILADQQGSQVMKDKIMEYVIKNRRTVIDQDDWKKTRKDHPSLYISVLELLAKV